MRNKIDIQKDMCSICINKNNCPGNCKVIEKIFDAMNLSKKQKKFETVDVLDSKNKKIKHNFDILKNNVTKTEYRKHKAKYILDHFDDKLNDKKKIILFGVWKGIKHKKISAFVGLSISNIRFIIHDLFKKYNHI